METNEILRVTTGTSATIGYECAFSDNATKTVTVGSLRTSDVPANLASRVNNFNTSAESTDFPSIFVSPKTGANFTHIQGVTLTVKAISVLID